MQPTALTKQSTNPLIPWDFNDGSRPFFQLRAQHAPALFGFCDKPHPKPRARSLRDAAEYIFFPEKLAHTLGRPQQLVDNWLPVAIPDGLAHAFGCGVSADAGRALLRGRLADLCRWLNARLDETPDIVENGPCRMVTVFGCVGYNLDFVSRRVSAARIHANGARQELNYEIELLRPLATGFWLHWVLEDMRLGANQTQLSLFVTPRQARWHDEWLVNTAYFLLKSDPRFEELREATLPRALALNRDFFALSLHARHADWMQGFVPRSTFNLVWRHEALFRRVARENPQLLKLLELFLWQKKLPLERDAVAEMRDYFLSCGFTDAAWRYVHKHGSRLFRVAWEMSTNRNRLDVCVYYLRVLEAAGLPPPPARSMAVSWFRCHVDPQSDKMRFSATWCSAHPTVVRAILLEADAHRRQPHFAQFVDDAVGVLHWAMETDLTLNPQQARSGWKWLVRNWQSWRASRRREEQARGKVWQSLLPPLRIGRYDVLPLVNGAELLEEALAMHHCGDIYTERCVNNDNRLFSVRCRETGRRVATLGIQSWGDGCWTVHQVKRHANRQANRELETLAAEVAQLYTQRCPTDSGQARLDMKS